MGAPSSLGAGRGAVARLTGNRTLPFHSQDQLWWREGRNGVGECGGIANSVVTRGPARLWSAHGGSDRRLWSVRYSPRRRTSLWDPNRTRLGHRSFRSPSPRTRSTSGAASRTVTATAHITDDLSGVADVRVFYRSPSGSQVMTIGFSPFGGGSLTGTSLDGTYTSVLRSTRTVRLGFGLRSARRPRTLSGTPRRTT